MSYYSHWITRKVNVKRETQRAAGEDAVRNNLQADPNELIRHRRRMLKLPLTRGYDYGDGTRKPTP